VPLIAGLYSRRPTARAALVTMIVSLAATGLAFLAPWFNPFAIGIVAGAVAMAVGSQVPGPRSQVPSCKQP
jgi:hypothetical protein